MKINQRKKTILLMFYITLMFSYSTSLSNLNFYLAENSVISKEVNSLIDSDPQIKDMGILKINEKESVIYTITE